LFGDDNFLLVTSDHIHSHELIKEVANTNLQTPEISAAVLVDESDSNKRLIDVLHSNDVNDVAHKSILPKTAVLVRTVGDDVALATPSAAAVSTTTTGKRVTHVGRVPLRGANAIEAGLMACGTAIFAALEELAATGKYFALCEALQDVAAQGKLRSIGTKGKPWFAVETTGQLKVVKDGDSLFPWQVLVASTIPPPPNFGRQIAAVESERSHWEKYVQTSDEAFTETRPSKAQKIGTESWIAVQNAEQAARHESVWGDAPTSKRPRDPEILYVAGARQEDKGPAVSNAPDQVMFVRSSPTRKRKSRRRGDSPPTSLPSFLCVPRCNAPAIPSLPSDIQEISIVTRTDSMVIHVHGADTKNGEKAAMAEEVVHVEMTVVRKTPLIGWIMLINAGLASSAIGACFDKFPGVDPLMKNLWRTSTLLCFLIPWNLYHHRNTNVSQWMQDNMTPFLLRHVIQVFCGYFVLSIMFSQSLEKTSVGHAYLFGGCTSLILVFLRLCAGEKVGSTTLLSVVFAICGAVVCMQTPPEPESDPLDPNAPHFEEASPSLVGDLMAFTVSIGGVFFYGSTKELRKKNWDVLTIYVVNQVFLLTVASLLVYNGIAVSNTPTFDRHPVHGFFGWTDPSNAPLLIFTALYCDIVGIVGYMAVLKYFDPLVITVVTLLEPLFSIVIGCVLGMAPIPAVGTWVGGAMMIAGALGVADTGKTKETVDATDAILASPSRTPKQMASYKKNDTGTIQTGLMQGMGMSSGKDKVAYGTFQEADKNSAVKKRPRPLEV
jgi:drug/metabolite transporter (DMT)-like permease